MNKWYEDPGTPGSNVIYSRIRLVRNWREYPFPGKMTREQSAEMTESFMKGWRESGLLKEKSFGSLIWTGWRIWKKRRFSSGAPSTAAC